MNKIIIRLITVSLYVLCFFKTPITIASVKNISAIHKKIVKNILSEFDFISKFAPR